MVQIIVLSGPIAVGKSSFVQELEAKLSLRKVSTSAWIAEKTGCERSRGPLQAAGEILDRETGGTWLADAVADDLNARGEGLLIVDSARTVGQVEALRKRFGEVFHIHLNASDETLEKRYAARKRQHREFETYGEVRASPTEAAIGGLAKIANLVLDTDYADAWTLAEVAIAYRGPRRQVPRPTVDVIVGGQYGSEGKGNVCAAIADRYQALVRIGGPNAGHLVKDPFYKYVQLPSGTQSNPDARIFLAAGSTLSLPQLLLEIRDCRLSETRLSIDPQAMVIDDEDLRLEAPLDQISSTRQGVGAALGRKILNRGGPIFGPPVRLARDIKQLEPFVRDVRGELDRMVSEARPILVEGTQGTALSLHHGIWPSVTSRETSAAGCLSDAGLAPKVVRRVIGVYRTYPIRVGGPSGFMAREIKSYEELADRSGISLKELKRVEKGTISGKQRRISEFDWVLFRRSVALNGVTDIALTFADYLGVQNREATRFEALTPETQTFIEAMERVAGAPVNLISKAFAKDGVIKRGDWA